MNVNYVKKTSGKIAAVCVCCSKESRPVKLDADGEPDLLAMPAGWSQSPFPADYVHAGGGVGSEYTCPACNKLARAGYRVSLRGTGTSEPSRR